MNLVLNEENNLLYNFTYAENGNSVLYTFCSL